ncbi:MAG TPA: hypothetical protein VLJ11_06315 [Bryobacteraceae bacterium]|nr:hypothetical protein [Bryobacteraceae bacterium]
MHRPVLVPFTGTHLTKPTAPARYIRPASSSAVRVQLSKVLESAGFVRAPRMRRFLEYIVQETLAGRANQLCEYSIGISVFGRDDSFEPGLDPIVRNDARRLRQKLVEYYVGPHEENDSQVRIEIPKGGYVPVFNTISHAQISKRSEQYRLSIKLIRIADGAEIWNTEHDFQGSGNFGLQLSVNRTPEI